MKKIPVVSFVGYSGSGKTTFLEKLIPELKARNIKVGIIKHHGHDIEIDTPGKDTWRHSRAGADAVAISTAKKVAVFRRVEAEMDLDHLARAMGDMDIVLTEGYKRGNKPKIEINRSAHTRSLITDPRELIAIVSDTNWEVGVPVFGLEDFSGVADFLWSRCGRDYT
ncbi:MAG: molybdopterin-guanine dinucleotide biosynthesis protein MobB [Peptococcaceae bacterium BICA1-7]|nr:MAG: molybdopterin-guanine dinucleotide biosynthesis protein MobB [Peptococcaceae bacterium BICA1-7]HBV96093.1 molybdopterin-guanine dinucleotide biosynthesis protein B [Desulfotomaculum sp.]